jgi:hypothetical protein
VRGSGSADVGLRTLFRRTVPWLASGRKVRR